MHRLLQLSSAGFLRHSRLPFGNSYENANWSTPCWLCKHSNVHSKTRSTIANPLQSTMKRKRKKSKKVYTEMLIEKEHTLSQQKANVQKLTFTDLKLLAGTNLSLSELYKLKDLPKLGGTTQNVVQYTYSNLSDITNIPDVGSDNIPELTETNTIKKTINYNAANKPKVDDDLANSGFFQREEEQSELAEGAIEIDNINDRLIKDVEEETEVELESEEVESHKVAKPKEESAQKVYREEITAKTLAAYIEVCSNLKNPQRGLNAFYFYRNKVRRCSNEKNHLNPIRNIKVYNSLLRGFAHKGNFQKISEILQIIQSEDVKMNVQSYVAIFECLGRINVKDNHLKEIRIYAREALARGYSFDVMMNEGIFLNNERELVLKAMKSFNPSYEPTFDEPIVDYDNHLLEPLNSFKRPIESGRKADGVFTPEGLKSLVDKQIEIEKKGFVTVRNIEDKGPVSEEVTAHRKSLNEHYELWEKSALTAFHRDLAALSAQRNAFNPDPFLRCLPAKEYVTIIVEEAKKIAQGSETYSPTVTYLYKDLGNKVYMRYLALSKEKTGVLEKIKSVHYQYCDHYATTHSKLDVLPEEPKESNSRQVWQWFDHSLKHKGATLNMDHRPWVPTTLQMIGRFLYHIIMHDLKIDVNSMRNNKHKNYLPAFYTIFRTQGRIIKEEVKPHPVLWKLLRASMPETLTFPAQEVPMICPPVPWISVETGSYLMSPSDVVRLPFYASCQKQRLIEAGSRQLYPSLDALNQLAGVPWKVNQRILDVILEVFNNGGSSNLDVPEPPSSLTPPPNPTPDMDKQMRYQLFKQRMQYRRKKAEMYSLWCDCLYRLSLANHFRNDIFWLPHNMDFRGRVYPIPPHLNHMGSDLARSILVFAESRPLGKHGLDWLKLHLINLTGLKKRDPISNRLKFANENLDLILDSAERPLTGKRWWTTSEEPWQTLACCIEIAEAIRSPDPEKYECHFPIHQDGSCNGLQHYAALGRDKAGAFSVNLTPSEEPQDVYSAVVALVEKQRAVDAENGVEIARVLEGFIKRKVIKQTIMTTVYGVTRFGARLQIAKQLKDIDAFPKEAIWQASSYLTGRTFDSLRTMFTSTKEIQDWFTECARLISSVGGQHVEWITPLGLPVVQPYFKVKRMTSSSVIEPFQIDTFEKPNVLKQKNAFPPNFIHSLDSSHMMLTALYCEKAGITFVSVHDCYWTHPSTVNIMNQICREQFVALHSEPILTDLSAFLTNKYSYNPGEFIGDESVTGLTRKKLNKVLRALPKTGDFDINQVLKSVYFFS